MSAKRAWAFATSSTDGNATHPDRVRSPLATGAGSWTPREICKRARRLRQNPSRQPGRAVPHRARLRPCGSGRPHAQRCGGEIRTAARNAAPKPNMAKLLASEAAWRRRTPVLRAWRLWFRAEFDVERKFRRPGSYDGAINNNLVLRSSPERTRHARNPIELLTPVFSPAVLALRPGGKQTRRPAMRMSTTRNWERRGDRRLDAAQAIAAEPPARRRTAAPPGERRPDPYRVIRIGRRSRPRNGPGAFERRRRRQGRQDHLGDRPLLAARLPGCIDTNVNPVPSFHENGTRRSKSSAAHVRLAARHPGG